MKFWDREREVAHLKRYLSSEPNAILFVYGPKSSGKSTLLMRVSEELNDGFVYYWYDLRQKAIVSYRSVLEVFFKERGWLKEFISAVMPKVNLGVFELDPDRLEKVVSGRMDAFEEIRKGLERVRRDGKVPVIVFDEIQKLKGIFMNGSSNQRSLVSELFNFFVALTKVEHLAHVLVMTSDTFFIEEVYTSSALKNTSEFYLVDYFDDETALRILVDEGLPEGDARYVVENVGGVPWMMERILSNGDVKEKVEELAMVYKSRLREILGKLYEVDESLQKECREFLKRFLSEGTADLEGKDRKCVKVFVENEVLFYDPVKGCVKFQTRLDERAARELLV